MRLISISKIKTGDIITVPIHSSNGNRILSAGVTLNDFYIDRLKQIGIETTCIEDSRYEDIIFKEPISAETRSRAIQLYKATVDAISKGKEINAEALKENAKAIVDDVRTSGVPVAIIDSIYPSDDVLALHAVNTAIISTAVGIANSYNFNQLCDVSLAGFIHDIGRQSNKDDDNIAHAQQGFEILRKDSSLSISSLAVILQHHENFDGSGLPRALKGTNISEYSRVVSVADYFDTLISGQNGVPMQLEKAFEEIQANDRKFDPEIIKAFKHAVQVYYTGAMVELSDGRNGIVVKQNKGKPLRPIVKMFSETEPSNFEEVNLLEDISLRVNKMIL